MRILVVAVSARMLAELAVRDGHEVTALDRFGDVDLRAIAACDTAADSEGLTRLAERTDAEAVVYGAGFENRPDLVRRLAAGRELLGTTADALPGLRDPWAVAAAAREAGARMPETRRPADRPPTGGEAVWLRKPRAGGGGRGIRRWSGGRLSASEILQRRVDGLSCSAVAVADGARAALLEITEQLHDRRFRWAGNAVPPRLPESERDELRGRLAGVCQALAARLGVRGAFGLDAVWDGHQAWIVEVNPRPTAALELCGRASFAAHLAAARGVSLPTPNGPAPSRCAKVKLVLFADRDLRAPDPGWWPAGLVRDVPHHGEAISRGAPVCTLVSADEDPEQLRRRGAQLLAAMPDRAAAHV